MPEAVKPKWYFAGQEKAKQWLDANTENRILNWQLFDKTIVTECFAIKPKGGFELEIVMFVYYKHSKNISLFNQNAAFADKF